MRLILSIFLLFGLIPAAHATVADGCRIIGTVQAVNGPIIQLVVISAEQPRPGGYPCLDDLVVPGTILDVPLPADPAVKTGSEIVVIRTIYNSMAANGEVVHSEEWSRPTPEQ